MTSNVGIWIDHRKAVIVFVTGDRAITRTVQSRVGQHPHYGGAQDGGGETKYEERFGLRLNGFFDRVIGDIGRPDAILVLGPGEAKHQFTARLAHSNTVPVDVVELAAADKLTNRQLAARVKAHFGLQVVRLSS